MPPEWAGRLPGVMLLFGCAVSGVIGRFVALRECFTFGLYLDAVPCTGLTPLKVTLEQAKHTPKKKTIGLLFFAQLHAGIGSPESSGLGGCQEKGHVHLLVEPAESHQEHGTALGFQPRPRRFPQLRPCHMSIPARTSMTPAPMSREHALPPFVS